MNYQPVIFRGIKKRCSKHSEDNPHTTSAEEALLKIQPACKKTGVTRLSDITGYDRIGIPVTNAIRPLTGDRSGGMSVSHGKGTNLAAATVSAAMESMERYYAYTAELPAFILPYAKLNNEYNAIPINKLALAKNSLFHVNHLERWTLGWDLMQQQEVAVPLELAIMKPFPTSLHSFFISSNGLAAGMNFLEAVSQALFEVIERDAVACHHMAAKTAKSPYPLVVVRLETIEAPVILELLGKIEQAGVRPLVFDCTVDTEVPTYQCQLVDPLDPEMILASGSGTNLDPVIAMSRAITEAAQARAVYLSGCREIFFPTEMSVPQANYNIKMLDRYDHGGFNAQRRVNAQRWQGRTSLSFEEDIERCLGLLRCVGVEQVIVVDLSPPEFDISVVRVIVPGMEGAAELLNYSPGARAKSYREGTVL